MHTKLIRNTLVNSIALALFLSTGAHAQNNGSGTAPSDTQKDGTKTELEKIVVTGSRLARSEAEGPAPLAKIGLDRIVYAHAKRPTVGKQTIGRFRSSARFYRGFAERNHIERRKSDRDRECRICRTDSVSDFTEESGSIFKRTTKVAFTRVCTEKFMAQITMTMLYIDEVETGFGCDDCCVMKVFDYFLQFSIAEHRVVGSDAQTTIEDRMVIHDLRLGTTVRIRTAVST